MENKNSIIAIQEKTKLIQQQFTNWIEIQTTSRLQFSVVQYKNLISSLQRRNQQKKKNIKNIKSNTFQKAHISNKFLTLREKHHESNFFITQNRSERQSYLSQNKQIIKQNQTLIQIENMISKQNKINESLEEEQKQQIKINKKLQKQLRSFQDIVKVQENPLIKQISFISKLESNKLLINMNHARNKFYEMNSKQAKMKKQKSHEFQKTHRERLSLQKDIKEDLIKLDHLRLRNEILQKQIEKLQDKSKEMKKKISETQIHNHINDQICKVYKYIQQNYDPIAKTEITTIEEITTYLLKFYKIYQTNINKCKQIFESNLQYKQDLQKLEQSLSNQLSNVKNIMQFHQKPSLVRNSQVTPESSNHNLQINTIQNQILFTQKRLSFILKRLMRILNKISMKWQTLDVSSCELINIIDTQTKNINSVEIVCRDNILSLLKQYFYNWNKYEVYMDIILNNQLICRHLNSDIIQQQFKSIVINKKKNKSIKTNILFQNCICQLFKFSCNKILNNIKIYLRNLKKIINFFCILKQENINLIKCGKIKESNKNHIDQIKIYKQKSPSSESFGTFSEIKEIYEKLKLKKKDDQFSRFFSIIKQSQNNLKELEDVKIF